MTYREPDERTITQLEQEFLEASVAVWREVDQLTAEGKPYPGIPFDSDLRIRERQAWEAYRDKLEEIGL